MELEKQVVSLDLSKRLKELGVKQESLFYWVEMYEEPAKLFSADWALDKRRLANKQYHNYSAFTVAEMGEMLPKTVKYFRSQVTGDVMQGRGTWPYYSELWQPEGKTITRSGDTEADARAKMLIYLLENKLLTSQ
jgi:hypothetical protein